jgi:hypothetical protein
MVIFFVLLCFGFEISFFRGFPIVEGKERGWRGRWMCLLADFFIYFFLCVMEEISCLWLFVVLPCGFFCTIVLLGSFLFRILVMCVSRRGGCLFRRGGSMWTRREVVMLFVGRGQVRAGCGGVAVTTAHSAVSHKHVVVSSGRHPHTRAPGFLIVQKMSPSRRGLARSLLTHR